MSIPIELVSIPTGSFIKGSPDSENGRVSAREKQTPVSISKPFSLGKYPITREQWKRVLALPKVDIEIRSLPYFGFDKQSPVENITKKEAVEFCKRLSESTGHTYRLPTDCERISHRLLVLV